MVVLGREAGGGVMGRVVLGRGARGGGGTTGRGPRNTVRRRLRPMEPAENTATMRMTTITKRSIPPMPKPADVYVP